MAQDTYFTCHIHHLDFRISLVYFHLVNCAALVTYAKRNSSMREKKLIIKVQKGKTESKCVLEQNKTEK